MVSLFCSPWNKLLTNEMKDDELLKVGCILRDFCAGFGHWFLLDYILFYFSDEQWDDFGSTLLNLIC